jgi:muramidase (phage lysozyme)
MAYRLYGALFIPLTLLFILSGLAKADVAPLVARATPLFDGALGAQTASNGSLFAGTQDGSFFAPFPVRAPAQTGLGVDNATANLLTLISRAEAGAAGYDAVIHNARIRPPRAPTQLTLGEIYAWIAATPGQNHAIGRYQFIPDTLRRVAGIRGYGPEVPFTPDVQDSLAAVLLDEAGLQAFEEGRLGRLDFMHNLARIWAGLPLPNGRSYYQGYAGNRATMSWDEFNGGMQAIWPTG